MTLCDIVGSLYKNSRKIVLSTATALALSCSPVYSDILGDMVGVYPPARLVLVGDKKPTAGKQTYEVCISAMDASKYRNHKIMDAWVILAMEEAQFKDMRLYLKNYTGDDYTLVPVKSETRLNIEKTLGEKVLEYAVNAPVIGELVDRLVQTKEEEINARNDFIKKRLLKTSFLKDKMVCLYHIPQGKIGGVASGYSNIRLSFDVELGKDISTIVAGVCIKSQFYTPGKGTQTDENILSFKSDWFNLINSGNALPLEYFDEPESTRMLLPEFTTEVPADKLKVVE